MRLLITIVQSVNSDIFARILFSWLLSSNHTRSARDIDDVMINFYGLCRNPVQRESLLSDNVYGYFRLIRLGRLQNCGVEHARIQGGSNRRSFWRAWIPPTIIHSLNFFHRYRTGLSVFLSPLPVTRIADAVYFLRISFYNPAARASRNATTSSSTVRSLPRGFASSRNTTCTKKKTSSVNWRSRLMLFFRIFY